MNMASLIFGFRIPYGRKDEFVAVGFREPNNKSFGESLRLRCQFPLLTYLLQE